MTGLTSSNTPITPPSLSKPNKIKITIIGAIIWQYKEFLCLVFILKFFDNNKFNYLKKFGFFEIYLVLLFTSY